MKLPDATLQNFPPERRWQQVQGALDQARPQQGDHLVSIGGLDHEGERTSIWVDLPNAMHLLHLLTKVQHATGAPYQMTRPAPTKPHSSD